MMYSSSENVAKELLKNPYSPWTVFYDLEKKGLTSESLFLVPTSKEGRFYVVAADNIVSIEVDTSSTVDPATCGCGEVYKASLVFSSSGPTRWSSGVTAAASSDGSIWLASSETGLMRISAADGSFETVELPHGGADAISALTYIDAWGQLIVGTPNTLYSVQYQSSTNVVGIHWEWITGILDSTPLDFSYDSSTDFMWLAESHAVHRRNRQGQWRRYGFHQGSPFISNITSVHAAHDYVWVGSTVAGLARMSARTEPTLDDTLEISMLLPNNCEVGRELHGDPWEWKYYAGHKFIVDNAVLSVVSSSLHSSSVPGGDLGFVVLVATSTGISTLQADSLTLAVKASALSAAQYRHDRHGLTAEATLSRYGDVSSYSNGLGANDGLWTAMHAIGEAFAFAITKDENIRQTALRALEGIEMLFNCTDAYPYYPARSFCFLGEPNCPSVDQFDENMHLSATVPGCAWDGDTSSDEIDGHLSALPVIYDLVAETDEEKRRVYTLIDGLTGGIVDNDYYLIDPTTNQPTLWGFWNPDQLNGNPEHYSERGANSLGILGYLASAYSITRNTKYRDAYNDLVNKHGYIRNALNVKIDNPDDDNHSDNELISLSFHTLFYAWYRIS
jgi:hypothetical protein